MIILTIINDFQEKSPATPGGCLEADLEEINHLIANDLSQADRSYKILKISSDLYLETSCTGASPKANSLNISAQPQCRRRLKISPPRRRNNAYIRFGEIGRK